MTPKGLPETSSARRAECRHTEDDEEKRRESVTNKKEIMEDRLRSVFYYNNNQRRTIQTYINMEEWLIYSLLSCLLYSIWTIFNKLSSLTIDSATSNLIQLPIRIMFTLVTVMRRMDLSSYASSASGFRDSSSILSIGKISLQKIGELNLYGTIYTFISCIASVSATFFLGDALEKGGSASSVAIIAGSYPALSYILCVLFGLEQIELVKMLGVCLAMGSCYCFTQ